MAEWVKDQNGKQAAIRAGAKENSAHVTASRWLHQANVKAALVKVNALAVQRVQESQQQAVASAEWIIGKAVEVVERAMTPVAVYYQGKPTDELQWAGNTAVAALALLAKRHPEFREAVPAAPNQTLVLNGLSDAQLDAAIVRLSGRA